MLPAEEEFYRPARGNFKTRRKPFLDRAKKNLSFIHQKPLHVHALPCTGTPAPLPPAPLPMPGRTPHRSSTAAGAGGGGGSSSRLPSVLHGDPHATQGPFNKITPDLSCKLGLPRLAEKGFHSKPCETPSASAKVWILQELSLG